MRVVLLPLVLLAGCSGFKEGFQKGFDKSFLENCVKGAKEKGATDARANEYCQCALKKVSSGESIDNAAAACQ